MSTIHQSNALPKMIKFFVPGIPAPGGSKKSFAHHKTGKIIVMDACERNKSWRDRVASFAIEAMAGSQPLMTAINLEIVFVFPRPRSHYRTGKNAQIVKESAPAYHRVRPDATKCVRSTEDALTGIVWGDDAQIVKQYVCKVYTQSIIGQDCESILRSPGAYITVQAMENS